MKSHRIQVLAMLLSVWFAPMATAAPATQPVLLGSPYRSPANGIALRPPVNCTRVLTGVPGEVVEFNDDDEHWSMKVTRISLAHPVPLTIHKDQFGQDADGLLEQTIKRLADERAGQIVMQNVVHVGSSGQVPVGILVLRRDDNFQRRLVQEALVEANDQVYYMLELNTPARPDAGGTGEDAGERQAADTFNQVVDSVELLDRAAVFADQTDRLIRFRGLIANWTPAFLASRMGPPEVFRLIRDGQDIGYTYEINEYDDKDGKIAGTAVLRVSVRSDTSPAAGTALDVQSRLVVTVDRKHENWVNLASLVTPAPAGSPGEKAGPPRQTLISEFGASDQKTRAQAAVAPGGGLDPTAPAPNDTIQPGIRLAESWALNVVRSSGSSEGPKQEPPPFKADVPAFYLPQAMSFLLPRLLPYKEPKTYMCATYVPDGDHGTPAVMNRYIDILPPAEVNLGGTSVVAVPVKDRMGLEGNVTTHYLDPDTGAYLGSTVTVVGKDGVPTTDLIVASDEATVRRIWPHCNLTVPDRIVDQPIQVR